VGEVYIYKKEASGTWVEDQIVQGDDTEGQDFYGWSISKYENELIVGSPREDHDVNGDDEIGDAGSAYIFNDPSLLGLADYEGNTNEIRLYPNPAQSNLTIESHSKTIANLKVYSISGALLQEVNNVNANTYSMNISQYNNGVYFVTIRFEDGSASNQKIIRSN
jgi:hypothetical protein